MLRYQFTSYYRNNNLLWITLFRNDIDMHISTDMEFVHRELPTYAPGPGSRNQAFELTSFICRTRVWIVDSRFGSSFSRSSIF